MVGPNAKLVVAPVANKQIAGRLAVGQLPCNTRGIGSFPLPLALSSAIWKRRRTPVPTGSRVSHCIDLVPEAVGCLGVAVSNPAFEGAVLLWATVGATSTRSVDPMTKTTERRTD